MKMKFTKLLGMVAAATAFSVAIADDHHHHHHLAKDVDAFHAVLAPIWHARPGPERLPNACAKANELAKLADGIRSTDASNLVSTIARMQAACAGKQDEVDAAFFDVHEAFHHLLDAKPTPVKR